MNIDPLSVFVREIWRAGKPHGATVECSRESGIFSDSDNICVSITKSNGTKLRIRRSFSRYPDQEDVVQFGTDVEAACEPKHSRIKGKTLAQIAVETYRRA